MSDHFIQTQLNELQISVAAQDTLIKHCMESLGETKSSLKSLHKRQDEINGTVLKIQNTLVTAEDVKTVMETTVNDVIVSALKKVLYGIVTLGLGSLYVWFSDHWK